MKNRIVCGLYFGAWGALVAGVSSRLVAPGRVGTEMILHAVISAFLAGTILGIILRNLFTWPPKKHRILGGFLLGLFVIPLAGSIMGLTIGFSEGHSLSDVFQMIQAIVIGASLVLLWAVMPLTILLGFVYHRLARGKRN